MINFFSQKPWKCKNERQIVNVSTQYIWYHLFNSIYRFLENELFSDTNEIQRTHCIQFD